MKFVKLNNNEDSMGTSLQGYVTATYQQLKSLLGEPTFGPDGNMDGKVTCEWVLKFEDGSVVTVYDWKTYSRTPRKMYEWHVGGTSPQAEALIQGCLE